MYWVCYRDGIVLVGWCIGFVIGTVYIGLVGVLGWVYSVGQVVMV